MAFVIWSSNTSILSYQLRKCNSSLYLPVIPVHVVNELGQLIFSEWYGSLIVHACVHVHACIIVYMHVCIVSLTRVFRYQTQHHCHGIPCWEAGGCVQEQYTGSNSFPWRQTHGPLQSLQLVSWSVCVCVCVHSFTQKLSYLCVCIYLINWL